MRIFEFRLQRVLDYRRLVEGWAKDAYLDTRVRRLEAEADLHAIEARRQEILRQNPSSVDELLGLERYLVRLQDEERAQQTLISILVQEEETAQMNWIEKRKEAESLERLRTEHLAEWQYEADAEEQKALDEWAVTRRKAA